MSAVFYYSVPVRALKKWFDFIKSYYTVQYRYFEIFCSLIPVAYGYFVALPLALMPAGVLNPYFTSLHCAGIHTSYVFLF